MFRELIRTPCLRGGRAERNADFVFPAARVAVFLDGDFWHGNTRQDGLPGRWREKIRRNAERDRESTAALEAEGWLVMRTWESDFMGDPVAFVDAVEAALATRGH